MEVPQGRFELGRYQIADASPLRAWDAADELALAHLAQTAAIPAKTLVVNDAFGALAVALSAGSAESASIVTSWSDSLLAHRGAAENLRRNAIPLDRVDMFPSTDNLADAFGGEPPNSVVVKIPRSLDLLVHQLQTMRPHLRPGSVVVGAGMTRHIHNSTVEAFESAIGSTTTSRARKKARLILAEVGAEVAAEPERESQGRYSASFGGLSVDAVALPGVFSARKLDAGTRLFLDALAAASDDLGLPAARSGHIVDLGCGNGIVGAALALAHPEVEVTFIDESYLAVAAARETYSLNVGDDRATFTVGDCLEGIDDGSVDVVVNNPPFHDNNALSDAIAWRMFNEAKAALRPEGRLWVVGNRHLAYHAKLARVFRAGTAQVRASDPKFVVMSASPQDSSG